MMERFVMSRKRYVQVGTGGRGRLFRDAIYKDWSKHCELVALVRQSKLGCF